MDDDGFYSDAAFAAVQRHGHASTDSPLRFVPAGKRTRTPAEPPKISDDSRTQYDHEFRELVYKRLDAGMPENCGSKLIMPECCARHAALSELGCLEVWDVIDSQPFVSMGQGQTSPIGEVSARVFCPRCESVGHLLAGCPFPDDAETHRIAALRRERREGEKVKAA